MAGDQQSTINDLILQQVRQANSSIAQMQELQRGDAKETREAIGKLHEKFDRKMDDLQSQQRTDAGVRATLKARIDGLVTRVNWLYVLLGGVIAAIVAEFMMGGAE